MPSRIQTTVDGMVCDESSTLTCSPTGGGACKVSANRPPAEILRTLMSCSLLAPISLATRSVGRRRVSERRSAGRGTAVDNVNVVDSNVTSS